MTQYEKLIERLRRAQGPSTFDDLRRVIEQDGWVLVRQRGSHVAFEKKGEAPLRLALVSGRSVKRVYVVEVLKRPGHWRSDG